MNNMEKMKKSFSTNAILVDINKVLSTPTVYSNALATTTLRDIVLEFMNLPEVKSVLDKTEKDEEALSAFTKALLLTIERQTFNAAYIYGSAESSCAMKLHVEDGSVFSKTAFSGRVYGLDQFIRFEKVVPLSGTPYIDAVIKKSKPNESDSSLLNADNDSIHAAPRSKTIRFVTQHGLDVEELVYALVTQITNGLMQHFGSINDDEYDELIKELRDVYLPCINRGKMISSVELIFPDNCTSLRDMSYKLEFKSLEKYNEGL